MRIAKAAFVFALMIFLLAPQVQGQKKVLKKRTLTASQPGLVFIRQNTAFVIKKMLKHLPATLNECRLAKWTMKSPKPPEDPNHDVLASVWNTNYDGMQVRIYSSVSPGYTGMIIAGIKLTIPVRTGYDRAAVSKWILNRYGTQTVVGSTAYRIEYRNRCWFIFRLESKEVIIELKWMG